MEKDLLCPENERLKNIEKKIDDVLVCLKGDLKTCETGLLGKVKNLGNNIKLHWGLFLMIFAFLLGVAIRG